jgi:hypothetical protein
MYSPATLEVTERKMSQFLEGSFGRLSSQEGGIPVYLRTVFSPDGGGTGAPSAAFIKAAVKIFHGTWLEIRLKEISK